MSELVGKESHLRTIKVQNTTLAYNIRHAKKEIGFFTNRQIISQLPDSSDLHMNKRRRRDNDGVLHENDEEERSDPHAMEQWKKQMTVFQTSLLLCMKVFHSSGNLMLSL